MHGYDPATSRGRNEKGFGKPWQVLKDSQTGRSILNVLDVIDRLRNAIMKQMAEYARMNKQNSEVIES